MVHLPPSPPPAKRLSRKPPKMYSSPSLMPPPFSIPGARALQDLLPPTPHSSDVTPGTVQTRTSWDSFFHPLLSRLDWGLSSARPALPRLHASSNSASRPSRPWAGSLTPRTRVASFLRPVPPPLSAAHPLPPSLSSRALSLAPSPVTRPHFRSSSMGTTAVISFRDHPPQLPSVHLSQFWEACQLSPDCIP